MADNDNHQPPGLGRLASRLGRTAFGALRNRAELLAVEWQQEKARLIELLFCALGLIFMAEMAMLFVTATLMLLFPREYWVYLAAGFALLYLAGACVLFFTLKSMLQREPFPESLSQLRKDRSLLDRFE